jgi:hypothetical protein
MTSDFDWKAVPQVRCGVLVSKVTEYLAAHPREVLDMELGNWTVEENSGRYAVVHRTGLANGIRPDNLPKTLDGTMPVLVGTGNGRMFLIDGAPRREGTCREAEDRPCGDLDRRGDAGVRPGRTDGAV